MDTTDERAPTLPELQRRITALIVSGTPLDAQSLRDAQLAGLIDTPRRGDVAERFRVYADGYPARLEEALREQFPAVAHVLGDGVFRALVRRYLAAVPLRSYNLNDAGAALPPFLAADTLTAALPFLPDLAQLEWRVACAFHARDEALLDPGPLAGWTAEQWEAAVLRFQPWVAVLSSDWPIREIWECRETPIEAIDIDLHHRADRVLVRRTGYAVTCESLDTAEADALDALLAGQALGAVLARLTANGSDPQSVSAWFSRWMAQRLITGCFLPHPPLP